MAKDNSFDIVSEIDNQEVDNAVNQALKEILNRFDFKNSKSDIKWEGKDKLILISDDEFKMANVIDILQAKLVKRGLSIKALKLGKLEEAANNTVKQIGELQQGISKELSKDIVKIIKDTKLKVQAQIQGEQVRVTGKNRDDLQMVMGKLREADLEIDLQFINFR